MTRVYRILRKAYAQKPFDGEGAYRFGGRWSSPGTRLVYAADLSLAMIEYFVHIDPDDPPRDLVSVTAGWRRSPAPPQLAEIGDLFARNR